MCDYENITFARIHSSISASITNTILQDKRAKKETGGACVLSDLPCAFTIGLFSSLQVQQHD